MSDLSPFLNDYRLAFISDALDRWVEKVERSNQSAAEIAAQDVLNYFEGFFSANSATKSLVPAVAGSEDHQSHVYTACVLLLCDFAELGLRDAAVWAGMAQTAQLWSLNDYLATTDFAKRLVSEIGTQMSIARAVTSSAKKSISVH